jgi:putative SOS response-associated peptidase YedK
MNVADDPAIHAICDQLEIQLWPSKRIFSRFLRATNPVNIIRQQNGQRRMDEAIWWLLLDKTDNGFKPSKYTSFNTRYDKLDVPRSAGYKAYRTSRCVIPVTGFGESEYKNGKPLHYHDMVANDGAFFLGGLYRQWAHPATGEVQLSCSVITLPPHPKLNAIHTKASPLMFAPNSPWLSAWLDDAITYSTQFKPLLTPNIPIDLLAVQIDKPSTYNAVDEPFMIMADRPITR